jgi:hypothetical protein
MNRVAYIKPDFPLDAFAGKVTYYLRYRVPYPQALLRNLVERAGARAGVDYSTSPAALDASPWPLFRRFASYGRCRTPDARGWAERGNPSRSEHYQPLLDRGIRLVHQ